MKTNLLLMIPLAFWLTGCGDAPNMTARLPRRLFRLPSPL